MIFAEDYDRLAHGDINSLTRDELQEVATNDAFHSHRRSDALEQLGERITTGDLVFGNDYQQEKG